MIEYLLSLSLLIVAVLFIRAIFRKTISPRVIYALWLVVVIRMLLPITLFQVNVTLPAWMQSHHAEQSETPETQPQFSETSDVGSVQAPSTNPIQTAPTYPSQDPAHTTPTVPSVTPIAPIAPGSITSKPTVPNHITAEIPEETALNWKQIAALIWRIGSATIATWILFTSISFNRRLYQNRKLHKIINKTKVYVSEGAGVPCIAGAIPSIYITPEAANSQSEMLIIIHEYTHLRHGDHIWAIVRALALIAFWWNPLVWAAASLSKQDAELACDDAMAAKLSEDTRLRYAHILLDTIPQKRRYTVGLGSAPLKERILMLTKRQKNRWICLLLALILSITAVGCAFVRIAADTDDKQTEPPDGTQTEAPSNTPQVLDRLPAHFAEFYHEAERVYALFTGYRFDIYTEDTYVDGEAAYRSVDIEGCSTLSDLRRLCERYFDTDLTNELLSRTVGGEYPLFIEHEGRLYRFDGYVALFGYDVGENYSMFLKLIDQNSYTALIRADMTENNRKITAEAPCTYIITETGEMRFTSFALMAEKLMDVLDQPMDYISLSPGMGSQKISLYYSVDDLSSIMANEFYVIFEDHEARIRTAMSAWIEGTWEPQTISADIEFPNMPADGVEDAILIFTTGTGTGVHIEEAYIINGASGSLMTVKAPYDIVETAVQREENGKCHIIDATGNRIDLPDNAFFTHQFKFYLSGADLYAEVAIGHGLLSYTGDHILVKYSVDGVAWEYVYDNYHGDTGENASAQSHGPFIGYVADKDTPWIELYTERDGTYVGRIPYEIFHDWIATDRDREGWTPGWMNEYLPFYYAEFGDFRWAAAHLADTVLGSGRKNIATSTDGGKTWSFGSTRDDYGGNHVVGMGFVSDKIAFMSFEPNNEHDGAQGPVISRTTDGGKTWEVLDIPVPAAFAGDKLISGIPFFDGDVLYYPVWAEPSHGTRIGDAMYLVSYDKGLTWAWDETSVKSAAAGYASIPSAALDWQMAEQQGCISIAVAAEEVVFVRWQEGAGPYAVIETKSGELYAAKQNEDGYTAFYQIDTSYKDTALLKTYQNVFGEYGLCLSYTVGANASDICYFTLEDDMPTHVLICNKDAVTVDDIILEAYGSMGAQINVYRKENGALFMCDLNQAAKELFPEAKQLYLHRVSNHRYHHYELTFRIEIPENTYDYYGWFSNGALHLISEELLNT